jgi:hypothetical protein
MLAEVEERVAAADAREWREWRTRRTRGREWRTRRWSPPGRGRADATEWSEWIGGGRADARG